MGSEMCIRDRVPIVYYIERKLLEIENLRLLVRGKAAGLPEGIIEAHLTL